MQICAGQNEIHVASRSVNVRIVRLAGPQGLANGLREIHVAITPNLEYLVGDERSDHGAMSIAASRVHVPRMLLSRRGPTHHELGSKLTGSARRLDVDLAG